MANVSFRHIDKIYENGFQAVKDFNLEIKDGEFCVFLGPSGCGKTTTMRMVAGLEEITRGRIFIGDVCINDLEPKERETAMVFQNYALYPHMTVYENMAFGLKSQNVDEASKDERIREAARMLELTNLLERTPGQLSGGQAQRVAMGRAIVKHPKVFLFDEPLSNLDAKLRVQMRGEIAQLQKRLAATMIYVTHDQIEAMTMGDMIVVMNDGLVQQIGTPLEVYNRPVNTFVAGFIGTPPMNFLNCNLITEGGNLVCKAPGVSVTLTDTLKGRLKDAGYTKDRITFGIRPEDIRREKEAAGVKAPGKLSGTVEVIENLGSFTIIHLSLEEQTLSLKIDEVIDHSDIGTTSAVVADLDKAILFDADTGASLTLPPL